MAKLKTAVIRWKDTGEEMTVCVCQVESKNEAKAISKALENETPAFMIQDCAVWYYFDSYDPDDRLEDYYKGNNGHDWLLVSLSDDFELWEIEKELKNDD